MDSTTPKNYPIITDEPSGATPERILRNAHPIPTPARLASIDGRVIVELIILVARETVSPARRAMAGIPPIGDLAAELKRRASARPVVPR